MSSSSHVSSNQRTMRSVRSDNFALVTFDSKSTRNIDIFWLDFNGERVKYKCLEPNQTFEIVTYETHPWIFCDEESGQPMLANGEEVYFPRPYDGREQATVILHLPVYSLRMLGMMAVRRYNTVDQIKQLDIPRRLIPEILHKENIPYKVHLQF